MNNGIAPILVLGLLILVFLVCRAIVLWYWRVNEIVTLLNSIGQKLGEMATSGIAIRTELDAARSAPRV